VGAEVFRNKDRKGWGIDDSTNLGGERKRGKESMSMGEDLKRGKKRKET